MAWNEMRLYFVYVCPLYHLPGLEHIMNSARLVRLGLFAFVVTALLLLVILLTPLNPFAFQASTSDSLPTRVAVATRAVRAPGALPTNAAPAAQPTDAPQDQPVISFPMIPANPTDAFVQAMTLRRNGDYVRAATAFRAALQENPDAALARQAQFRLGEMLYLAADFTNAVPALQAVTQENDGDDLAARSHYFLGDIFTQQQKYPEALQELRTYRQRSQALAGVIDREIGDVLLASGDSAAAIDQYQVAFGDPTLTPAQRVTLLKKIAEVYTARVEPNSAATRLSEAFKIAPDDATRASVEFLWGQALYDAGEQEAAIAKWKHALATYTTQAGAHLSVAKLVELGVTNINDLQRGIANYSVGNYDLAIQAFRRYLAANESSGADVLYYAGMAYQRKGDQAGAVRNFDALLANYPRDARAADALYGKVVSLTRAGNAASALAAARILLKQFPNDARIDDGFWNAALTLEAMGSHTQAAAAYTELATTLPASTYAPMALFNAGVNYYLAQNYTQAKSSWNAALQKYPTNTNADSAAYWLGKLARLQGDENAAVQLFQQAAQPPRSYYSWRALDALNQPAPPPSYKLADYAMETDEGARAELEQWIGTWSGAPASATLPAAVRNDGSFKRGSEYAALDRPLEARPQFQAVNDAFKGNAGALYALAMYYQDNNYFSLSIDAAKKLADLSGQNETRQPRLLRQLIYPTYFADLVVPYAEEHGLDPDLFFALVRQESGFNPMSFSSADARGLTQVIPDTANGIASALGVSDFQQSDLFKPYISVRFGTYYLGAVEKMFNGNVYYALMGYNGGPGNARKWQRDDLDVAVEGITLAESHLYVRTVIAQYRQYVDVYRGGKE